uniref:VOC domain-containing protein n=1 Tax=Salix viminalis TaxID=40686 RepID=A0A6N2M9J6_SALVM
MGNIGEIEEEIERWVSPSPAPLPSTGTASMPLSLNHLSFLCKSVAESVKFYYDVLGPRKDKVRSIEDNHISFQCPDMNLVIKKLEEKGIEYVTAVVEEGGVTVDQLFFHDPDGYMVEICNCQNLPVLPLSACPIKEAQLGAAMLCGSCLCDDGQPGGGHDGYFNMRIHEEE